MAHLQDDTTEVDPLIALFCFVKTFKIQVITLY